MVFKAAFCLKSIWADALRIKGFAATTEFEKEGSNSKTLFFFIIIQKNIIN